MRAFLLLFVALCGISVIGAVVEDCPAPDPGKPNEPEPGKPCETEADCDCSDVGHSFMVCVEGSCACAEGDVWEDMTKACGLAHGMNCTTETLPTEGVQQCSRDFQCVPPEIAPGRGQPQVQEAGTCLCQDVDGNLENTNSGIEYYPEAGTCMLNVAYLNESCAAPGDPKNCYPFERSVCRVGTQDDDFMDEVLCRCIQNFSLNDNNNDCVADPSEGGDDGAGTTQLSALVAISAAALYRLVN